MTPKDKVKAIHPRANATKHDRAGGSGSYWCVWSQHSSPKQRLGTGKTQAEAWKKALETIEKVASSAEPATQDQTGA